MKGNENKVVINLLKYQTDVGYSLTDDSKMGLNN